MGILYNLRWKIFTYQTMQLKAIGVKIYFSKQLSNRKQLNRSLLYINFSQGMTQVIICRSKVTQMGSTSSKVIIYELR